MTNDPMRRRVVAVYTNDGQVEQALDHLRREGLADAVTVEQREGLWELVTDVFRAHEVAAALERVNQWSIASH